MEKPDSEEAHKLDWYSAWVQSLEAGYTFVSQPAGETAVTYATHSPPECRGMAFPPAALSSECPATSVVPH